MRAALAASLCALVLLATGGCFRVGVTVGAEIPPESVARIVPGVTTKAEILTWFGSPAEATDGDIFARLFDAGEVSAEDLVALPFADLLVYEITDGEARALVTILFNWVRVDLHRDRLMVFFDENDVVLYYGITRQRGEAGEDAAGDDALAPDDSELEDEEELEDLEFEHPAEPDEGSDAVEGSGA